MVNTAYKAARKIIESTYRGIATVTEYQKIKNEKSKLTKPAEVVVLEKQPCLLSFERIQVVTQSESAASVTQSSKLFISPDIIIKPGSKITIVQDGVTTDFTCSGVPATYPTHQEIMLDLSERWS